MAHSTKKTNKSNHRKHELANGTQEAATRATSTSPQLGLSTFKSIVTRAERCVYLVVRIRPDSNDPQKANYRTLGTGFIAAPYRLVTGAHVLDQPASADELLKHKEGDVYLVVRHQQNDFSHRASWPYRLGHELFIYPAIDLGVIHLRNDFYKPDQVDNPDEVKEILKENDYLRISDEFCRLATPVGVLGYPVTHLNFVNGDFGQPMIREVLLRVDQGIVNTRDEQQNGLKVYEFTIAFNSGNSGGPIINLENGTVLAWVHGYKKIDTDLKEKDIDPNFPRRQYMLPTYMESTQAVYSRGIATTCAARELRSHGIVVV